MKQLESEQQFDLLKQGATVFEFTAGWCPDCRVIEPDLPECSQYILCLTSYEDTV